MTTVPIHYEIKDLFNKEEWKSIEDEFSCIICFELIYKQEWYQCKQGHLSCRSCWSKILNGPKRCPTCRVYVKSLFNGLSRCRFIEQTFANKKICCPYSYKDNILNSNKFEQDLEHGCKELIKIEQLDNHQKNCTSRFIKCNNEGCDNISRYFQHLNHQQECQHAIIQCELCESEIKRSSLSEHQESCLSRMITCTQCTEKINEAELDEHINEDCSNTIIDCDYKDYGCDIKVKRSKLSNHLEQVNHSTYMSKLIQDLSDGLCRLKQSNTELKERNQELEQSNKKCNDLLKKLIINNDISYSNTWIISNYLQRTGIGKEQLYSSAIDIPPYSFKLSTFFKNQHQRFYLNLKGAEDGAKVNAKFKFKIINHKDETKNKICFIDQIFVLNGIGWGTGFQNVEFSIESGYVFPDGSVKLEFTIDIKKPPIQS